MVFSYNWLKDYTKKIPTPEKLAEILSLKIFEVEGIKKEGEDYLLDIDVLPNRGPDCLSYWGLSREISAISGARFVKPKFKIKEDRKAKTRDFVSLTVENKTDCNRYTAKAITNVSVGPSPEFIKSKLESVGLNSINNVVDVANFVMLETGQPLHIFDFDKIESANSRLGIISQKQVKLPAKSIIVERAKSGERITTLDNKVIDLDKDVLLISDIKGPLAIAGIKGGKRAEVDSHTKNIIIEAANFNGSVIRKASKKINLKTDASWRFENRIDSNLTEEAINRAAYLIKNIAGGDIAGGLVDFYPQKSSPLKIKINEAQIKGLLGVNIAPKEIRKILEKLGFGVTGGAKTFTVSVPSYRLDICLPEDLLEEIGRVCGYEKIPAVFPVVSIAPPQRNLEIFWQDMIKNILKEAGFFEAYNYSYIGGREADVFDYKKEEMIEILNPVSIEQKYLRPSQIPNLVKDAASNLKYFDSVKIFELGKIFLRPKTEKKMLTAVISRPNANDLFFEGKGIIDSLLKKLGIIDFFYDEYRPSPEESKSEIWQKGRCAEIKIGTKEIGFLGEISPKISSAFKANGKIIAFDIDFEKLISSASEEHEYRPISQHPAATRDLAVLVPLDIRVEDVLNLIEIGGGELVRDIDLFDIYEGEGLPDGKKNLAFHIIYQASDRTLKSEEIDETHNKIIKLIEQNPEWEARR